MLVTIITVTKFNSIRFNSIVFLQMEPTVFQLSAKIFLSDLIALDFAAFVSLLVVFIYTFCLSGPLL